MSTYYVDKSQRGLGGYTIFHGPEGYRWGWEEVARGEVHRDYGKWRDTRAEALRDAADDWESNGNSSNRRLGGTLRAAATRSEQQESEPMQN